MTKEKQMQVSAWGLSGVVLALAVAAWGQSYNWQLTKLTLYQIFPLLGLTAFSLMWSHYVASALRQYFQLKPAVLAAYFEVTSAVVLAAIVLHPGLAAWQLWQDGLGLPPGSYKLYTGAAAYWAIFFGLTGLVVFLAYEFRRFFGTRPWWRFVQYASDIGMFLIFFHALRLGGELQTGWFRWVWYFYGLSLASAMVYSYSVRSRAAKG